MVSQNRDRRTRRCMFLPNRSQRAVAALESALPGQGCDAIALQAGASGVKLVMSWKNAPKLKPAPLFNSSPKAAGPSDLPIMLDNRIHWNGEAIAVWCLRRRGSRRTTPGP